ncbi:MAG TPA: PAS domain-containing protein, partial [Gammaproteobacteria bacterium]|nr:PAS domain-containing protein [Gammaproteobacteria bacterium]
NLMQQYQAAVQQFLHALDTLALGEKPIHHDIDQGRYANYALQVMVVAVVFYLLVLIIIFQQRNKKVLLGSFQQVQEAQQSLAKREKYLALTLDSIGDGVIATDASGNVARMNPIAEQLTGWTVQDAMGKPLKHIFHIVNAFSREPVADPVEKVLQSGQIVGLANHTLLVAKDGSEYQIADSGAPICDDDDNILGVILVFRDVTEEYRLQEEIRASRDELEQRVAERTKELESFSYAVSHDLRAPLRSINGFSQVLQDDYYEQLDDDGKDYLQRIASAALHMGELIDAMLVLSQITRKNIQHKPVDLSRLAGTIIEELENCNATQNVDWVISQGLHCTGDPELIKIALENLLNNALKYSSKNDRQTRIEFGRMEKEGQPVFFVRDNGCGFDARHANRLFTPFQRLHGKEYEGTGIGLATVQRVIDRHHGHIWAESEPEQGATFYFSLPQ